MAIFNKFNSFVEALAEGEHNLGSDQIKAMFTNNAPVATNATTAELTEITAENGYPSGGPILDIVSSSQAAGTYTLIANDEVVAAAGGTIGPFRYIVLYNETSTGNQLIGWYDYGTSITLNDGETFTIDFGASVISFAMIEIVYRNRDNPNTIILKHDGVVIDFSAVTRMVLTFSGSEIVADTDIDNTLIDWSQGSGVIEFNINDLAITVDHKLPATLIAYDPDHIDGQVLLHAYHEQLFFQYVT